MSQATELKTKFTTLLKQMFQLDQPELDFGLYKIMHAKAERINAFLDKELEQQIDAVFADADQADQHSAIEAAKQTLITQLGEGAFDEKGELVEHFKGVPAAKDYLKVVDQAKAGKGNLSGRAVIYDHLIRFFSRYYDGGDFMSRRYHVAENKSRAAAYAVPYDGSEVYLHWANKDQYYIKTTESFNEYSFNIREAAAKQAEQASKQNKAGTLDFTDAPQLGDKRIHFKLVDAEQGAQNNNKETEKRQFFIRKDNPIAMNEAGELEVYFEFRVATNDDAISAEQEKQLKARFGKSANKGDLPNLYITQVIQDALSAMPEAADYLTFAEILAPTDKIPQRPLLTKYLNNYTSKNTMDYFIHKDLGGFLQRELDFYIKNEIMRLDDVEQADTGTVEIWLQQVKVLRRIAKDIIAFLAQLEDFQKKLWLKKKFVTETQYCITLDRLEKSLGLVAIALENEAQRQEWVSLFAIDLAELDSVKAQGMEAVFADEKFKYLVVDTQFFNAAFKDELLAEIEDLDEQSNGLLINSDNFQALNILQRKFKASINYIYIDPPYNTNSTPILYKNEYRDSSWMSLMANRLDLSSNLMNEKSVKTIAIDDAEFLNLSKILEERFVDKRITKITVVHNPKGSITKDFNRVHEYAIFITSEENKTAIARKLEKNKTPRKMRRWGENSLRTERRLSFYPIYIKNSQIVRVGEVPDDNFHPLGKNVELDNGEIEVWPIDQDGVERRWNFGLDSINDNIDRITVRKDDEGNFDLFLTHELTVPKTVWSGGQFDAGKYGNTLLVSLMGKKLFDFPKSINLVEECIFLSTNNAEKPIILDYFAGSGTTGHAVINLNREDQGNRKYILCEMGTYFDSVTKPRIQKVVYAKDWKDGKPVFDSEGKAGGVSQCFKYIRLEQYEDTLNNLVDDRTYNTADMPKDFILSYLLEAETAESPSLLNLNQFSNPANYQLKIKRPNSDEAKPQAVDLIETFNWLIGLNVVKLDKWRAFDCEFEREHDTELPNDQHTRLKLAGRLKQVDAYSDNASPYQIRTVEGWVRQQAGSDELRDSVLVIWRKLTDDPEKDSAFLEAYLEKLGVNQADTQFDKIYINGPHGLQLHGTAKTRLFCLEDTFIKKMFSL
ncbi:DNA methyltransferase [Thiomicrorhabdus sp. 6S3-12]|uniref:DNA methyltransferase n=1 Tax=Thiomicrorhabdus sp. 6S3-12 TaxID=2819681 RepID=UPI001AACC317|nr:site-specific DNA-methyltransferase [Thiomicrorhabdus sp. 6S3-12]MBO1923780.1 site-specific DNA-methyltransferase [Thiomicrorhabdus sp. 6S3-12]